MEITVKIMDMGDMDYALLQNLNYFSFYGAGLLTKDHYGCGYNRYKLSTDRGF